jgi:putative sigma-54 modulation protein
MQTVIKGKNLEVTDTLRAHIEKKLVKLDRLLPSIDEARVDLAEQDTKSAGDRLVVQLTLRVNGALLRAEERSSDMQTALDTVLERMSRQVERYKGKHYRSQVRPQMEVEEEASSEETAAGVVRVKRFQTRPMDTEEAIEQMELLGHDFFVFFDAASDAFSVVYRRRDGGYGLLLPELA